LNEFELFLKAERVPALNNILNWWKVKRFIIKYHLIIFLNLQRHAEEFPHLANMAKGYLAIPGNIILLFYNIFLF